MKVKNAVIIRALTGDRRFDPEQYLPEAKAALGGLAREFDEAGDRLDVQIRQLRGRRGKATHAHDYRQADASNLRMRATVLRALSDELRRLIDDRDHLLGLIESARKDAWGDISRAVMDTLNRQVVVVDDDYLREREERMGLVVDDLRRLMD